MGSRLPEKVSGDLFYVKKRLATLLRTSIKPLWQDETFRNSSPNTRPNPTPALKCVEREEKRRRDGDLSLKPTSSEFQM